MAIKLSIYLPEKYTNVVDAAICINSFLAMPENISLATIADENHEIHLDALRQNFKSSRTPKNPFGKWLWAKLAEILHGGSFQHANQKSQWAPSSKSCTFKVIYVLTYKNTVGLNACN